MIKLISTVAFIATVFFSSAAWAGSGHDLKKCEDRKGDAWVNCIQDQLHSPDSRHGGVASGGQSGGSGSSGDSGGSGGDSGGSGGGSGSSN